MYKQLVAGSKFHPNTTALADNNMHIYGSNAVVLTVTDVTTIREPATLPEIAYTAVDETGRIPKAYDGTPYKFIEEEMLPYAYKGYRMSAKRESCRECAYFHAQESTGASGYCEVSEQNGVMYDYSCSAYVGEQSSCGNCVHLSEKNICEATGPQEGIFLEEPKDFVCANYHGEANG